jgi:16S rRNA (guanine527-N7)-methyltransferase
MFHVKHSGPLTAQEFAKYENVSTENLSRLSAYAELLVLWNKKINLVSKSTLDDLWRRHFLDSAQIYPLIPRDCSCLVDLGSGAGFPGLVLAIMGIQGVHLIESDARKSAFLSEAARVSGADIKVINRRIEDVAPFPADVITARALAPLGELLRYSEPFLTPKTMAIFLKGLHIDDELTDAHKMWKLTVDRRPSRSDPSGTVLCVREVSHVTSS